MNINQVSTWVFGENGDVLAESRVQSLVATSMIIVTSVSLLSPLVADLSEVFLVSESRAGLIIIVFTSVAAVALPLAGMTADWVGRKEVLVPGVLLFGLAGFAISFVSRFELVLALRALQGIGFACAKPVVITLFGDLYQGPRETTVQSIRVGAVSIVTMIVPFISGVLFTFGWRFPFFLYLIAVPVAGLAWLTLPEVQTDDKWSLRRYGGNMKTLLSDGMMVVLFLSFLVRFVLFFGLLTYVSVIAQNVHLAVVEVGGLLFVHGLIKLISSTQMGRLVTRLDPAVVALGGFFFSGFGLVLMGVAPTASVLLFGIAFSGFGDGILSPTQKSLVNRLTPRDRRGGAMSVALTFQNLGKVVGPVGVGALLGVTGAGPAFVVLGAVGGTLGVVLLFGVLTWQDRPRTVGAPS